MHKIKEERSLSELKGKLMVIFRKRKITPFSAILLNEILIKQALHNQYHSYDVLNKNEIFIAENEKTITD